jgi:hypothetical protein
MTAASRPELREMAMGRPNGPGGIFSGESWTLSQAYYFGGVKHNPSREVLPIDEHVNRDEIRRGKSATTSAPA